MTTDDGIINKQAILLELIKRRTKEKIVEKNTSRSTEELIDHALLRSVAGCNVAWYGNGEISARSFGYAEPESHSSLKTDYGFRALCLVKVILAYTLLIYSEKHRLDLRMKLGQIVPSFRKQSRSELPISDVSLEDLLNHRLGLDETALYGMISEAQWSDNLIDKFQSLHRVFSPGESFMYSSLSYILIAIALEEMGRKSWLEMVEDYLFKPLNIDVRRYHENENLCAKGFFRDKEFEKNKFSQYESIGIPIVFEPAQASRICISCEDLIKLPVLLINKGVTSDGVKLLSDANISRLSSTNANIDYHHVISGWASGWFNFSKSVFGYITNGFGLHVLVAFDLETEKALVIQSNTKDSLSLLSQIYKEYFGLDLINPTTRNIDVQGLLGTYRSQGCDLIFSKVNDQVLVKVHIKDCYGNKIKEGGDIRVALGSNGSATALDSRYPFEGSINLFNCNVCNQPGYIRIKHTIFLKNHKCN